MRRSLLEDQRGRQGQGSKLLLSLLAVLAAGVTLAGIQGMQGQDKESSPLQHDVRTVWEWVMPEARGGAEAVRWSFRWDAEQMATTEQAEQLAALLAAAAAPAEAELSLAQRWWRSEWQREDGAPGGVLTVWYHPNAQPGSVGADSGLAAGAAQTQAQAQVDAAQTDADMEEAVSAHEAAGDTPGEEETTGGLVVLLESVEGADYEAIATRLVQIEQALNENGLSAAASFSFRAAAADGEAAGRLAAAAQAKLLERYSDRGTTSDTYYSRKLKLRVQSGEHEVNLQLAMLAGPTAGEYRLTGGIPLITGDYLQ